MWSKTFVALAACQLLGSVAAQNTFPSASDEIEELLYQYSGNRGRGFTAAVTPCTNEGAKGFRIAAGMVRTCFHDVAGKSITSGAGGLDASIANELEGDFKDHNSGPAFNATISWLYNFYNSRASMADLLALSLVTSVESCGGPQIPMKSGRKDATGQNQNGLPDAGDSKETLLARFAEYGFTPQEMIQLVACGHSLGGVHIGANDGIIAAAGFQKGQQAAANNVLPFDTTDAKFDNKVVSEYVSGTTQNVLVVGRQDLASDKRVFEVDNNVTVKAMADPSTFNGVCQNVLQKMIETVPSSVQLSSVIRPYDAKPGQLTINVKGDGPDVDFAGEVRIRTTSGSPSSVKLVYKTRNGDACKNNCEITTQRSSTTSGFAGESFTFYGFAATVPSISTFNIVASFNGQTKTYDNNGKGFTVSDLAFVQASSSSLSGGNLKVVVAARKGQEGTPSITLTSKKAFVYNTMSSIETKDLPCSQICSDELFTYFSCSGSVSTSQATSGKLEVSFGGKVIESFRAINFASSGVQPQCKGKATSSTSSTTSKSSTSSSLTTTTTSSVSSSSSSSKTSSTSENTSSTSKTSSDKNGISTTSSTSKTSSDKNGISTTSGSSSSSTSTKTSSTLTTTSSTTKSVEGTIKTTSTSTSSEKEGEHGSTSTSTDKGDDHSSTTKSDEPDYTPPSWTNYDPIVGQPNPTITGGSYNPTNAPWAPWNSNSALAAIKSIYNDNAHVKAPNGGLDGGNKRTHGLNLHITVKIVEVTIHAPTPIYHDAPTAPSKGDPVQAGNTWATAEVSADKQTWSTVEVPAGKETWSSADVPAATADPATWETVQAPAATGPAPAGSTATWQEVKASATKSGPIAHWTGAANSLSGHGAIMGAAAVIGAVAMVL